MLAKKLPRGQITTMPTIPQKRRPSRAEGEAIATAPEPRFKWGWTSLTGVLMTDPKRVWLTVGNPPNHIEYSSGHVILQLKDGLQVKVYADEDEPTQTLCRFYRAGDEVTLGGLLTEKGIFHVDEVPRPEGR